MVSLTADSSQSRAESRAVAAWLLLCAAMVFVMVVIGGATRLTGSGLSIVEWQPIAGILPPLGEAEWQTQFDKYKQTPEYAKVNTGMSLAGFKGIFWLEFIHRLWGRAIGAVFLLPFLYFLWRGRVAPEQRPHLWAIFALGGLQGAMGWYMVASGLVDRPAVSQYRLTAHLALAVAIYAYMLWLAFGMLAPRRKEPGAARARRDAGLLTALVFITMMAGALVAGLDAGLIYNTFPLMDGRWIPVGAFDGWLAPFEDIPTVQFDHRLIATVTLALCLAWFLALRRRFSPGARRAAHALAGMATVQYALGVATLLLAVPVWLGVLHQAGAMALFTFALWLMHELARPGAISPS